MNLEVWYFILEATLHKSRIKLYGFKVTRPSVVRSYKHVPYLRRDGSRAVLARILPSPPYLKATAYHHHHHDFTMVLAKHGSAPARARYSCSGRQSSGIARS